MVKGHAGKYIYIYYNIYYIANHLKKEAKPLSVNLQVILRLSKFLHVKSEITTLRKKIRQ